MSNLPKPAALRRLLGNPGKQPFRDDEPEPIPGSPDKPAGLSPEAAAEWDRIIVVLEGEQRLATADYSHVLTAATAYADAWECRRKAAWRSGKSARFQEWRQLKRDERHAWEAYRKAINDLCLSQGTRARAKTGGRGKATSRLEDFLARRKAAGPA